MLRYPNMLLLLLLLPPVVLWMLRARRLNLSALCALRGERETGQATSRRTLASCGWIAASITALILALAQPAWNPRPAPGGLRGRDVMVALDISRSMLAADVFPSRLEAAKIALFESLESLRGQRLGLITFAGSAAVRVPLTLDHAFVWMMIERASPYDAQVGSTSIQAAIEKAQDIVLRDSEQGRQDILLITDGEDHLSDISTISERLRDSEVRVLIVGLGDAETGARVPAPGDEGGWMQYRGQEVFSRLDDDVLTRLAEESPYVTYYRAETRPFDLAEIYHRFLAEPGDLMETDEGRILYTEGAPLLLLAALLLYVLPRIVPLVKKRIGWIALLLLTTACAPQTDPDRDAFDRLSDAGFSTWHAAQEDIQANPRQALALMEEAREMFLRAALLLPGNRKAAEHIAGVTRQMEAVRVAIEEQQREEKDLQELLQEAVHELAQLVPRQQALSNRSRQILRRRPPMPAPEREQAAAVAHPEQQSIQDATHSVLRKVEEAQLQLRNLLSRFAETEEPMPTEVDSVLELLEQALGSQETVRDFLAPDAAHWQQASPRLQAATRQLQDALDILQQSPDPSSAGDPGEFDEDEMDWDYDDVADDAEAGEFADRPMPMRAETFADALESNVLPVPDYTAEEILMQEAENQEKRSQRRAVRAGAEVEKNW